MINIRPITKTPCALGEGPLWDAQHQRLFWVDSFLGQIFCRDSGGTIKTWQMPCMIGSLAVINLDEILVALQSGLHRFNLSTHTLQLIHDPEPDMSTTRLNDGKTDRAGQFLFASMGVTDRTQGWQRLPSPGKFRYNFLIQGVAGCISPLQGRLAREQCSSTLPDDLFNVLTRRGGSYQHHDCFTSKRVLRAAFAGLDLR
jgi:hypothetical protein